MERIRKKKAEKKVDLREIGADLLKNLPFIILGALAAALAAFVITKLTYTPEYTAKASFYVRAIDNANLTQAGYSSATKLAVAYAEVISDPIVNDKLSEETGEDLDDVVFKASEIESTHIIEVSAVAPTPQRAYDCLCILVDNYGVITNYVSKTMTILPETMPTTPTSPSNLYSMKRNVAIGGLAGLLISSALFALLSFFSDTINTEAELEERLDVKVFGSIVDGSAYKKKSDAKALLISDKSTPFEFSENIRRIAARVERLTREGVKSVMITSFGSNEGKSTIAANIAMAIAESGRSVLLIDSDFRNPSQYRIFDLEKEGKAGFSELLNGEATFGEAVVRRNKNFHILPVYRFVKESTEIIGSEKFDRVMDELKTQYDLVIVDTPPTAFVADAEIVSGKCDASLLIVYKDTCSASSILGAVEALEGAKSKFCGCIFNGASPNSGRRFGRSRYYGKGYYGYGKHS